MATRDIDVIICSHDVRRYQDLAQAVASVRRQSAQPRSVVVVVDHHEELRARAALGLDATVIANDGPPGASGARNAGARATEGGALAFLDDDAVADVDWLAAFGRHLGDGDAPGLAGRILPAWRGGAPRWFPPEFLWAVGATYTGFGRDGERVRNGWSGNLCVRRSAFEAVGGFREGFGKVGGAPNPEDTDLCLRVNAWAGRSAWRYVSDAVVHHAVPVGRSSLGFFLRRSFQEGRGKRALQRLVGEVAVGSESRFMTRTVPAGLRDAAVDVLAGDATGLARAGALLSGVAAAATGYGAERLREVRARPT